MTVHLAPPPDPKPRKGGLRIDAGTVARVRAVMPGVPVRYAIPELLLAAVEAAETINAEGAP